MMDPSELQTDDDYLRRIADGFTGALALDPAELLFPEDQETTLSIWDDVDWWSGEAKGAPEIKTFPDATTTTAKERAQGKETFALSTPGSSAAFQAAEAATGVSKSTLRWFQQDNGRIDRARLVAVGGGTNFLRPDAAGAFKAMKRDAKKKGINIVFSGAQSGYRDYATQVRLFHEKGDSDTGGLAADPGTSNHGWGMAIDIGPEARTWVRKHGAKYGFHGISTESWHFDYRPTDEAINIPKTKKRPTPTRTVPQRGRDVGANDLTSTIPIGQSNFTDAILSLVHEDVTVDTVKGKRTVNLAGIDKPKNTSEIVAYARKVAKSYGWTGKQFQALYELGMRESGWNPQADNPDSTADGIPQRLMSAHPFTKGEKAKWKDPRYQVRWFLRYIANRYSSPTEALKWHDEKGWY